MIELIAAIVTAIAVALAGWFARGAREARRRERERVDGFKAKEKARQDAEIQDDTSLADRISRR